MKVQHNERFDEESEINERGHNLYQGIEDEMENMMKEEEDLICKENTSFEIKEEINIDLQMNYEPK